MAASAASSRRGHRGLPPRDSWDSMLPGPPSRDNGGGCADLSAAGLLAYGAGSSVVVADPRSMQLVSVLPMPSPSRVSGSSPSSGLAPFVTSVRWTPQPLPRDLLALEEPSFSHLRLAVGDRQGRIAIWEFRSRRVLIWLEFDPSSSSSSSDRVKLGVQDLCWVRSDLWILASISGPSLVALWDTVSGRCIWKYDASPEFLSCIRRDPFDVRHFCTLGLRGFILSAKVLGGKTAEDIDVFIKEHQVPGSVGDLAELQRIEKEALSSGTTSALAPAFAVFPHPLARFCFSRLWRHILLVTFPREMILFDLQYGTSLSCISMPRGCGKIMDVIADPDEDLVYCAHLDGKLSTWRRKNEQGHALCTIEDLMPSIGNPVPSPSVLTVILSQSESTIQHVSNLGKGLTNVEPSSSMTDGSFFDFHGKSSVTSKKYLLSISDDGKIWNWRLVSDLASHGDGSATSQLLASGGEGNRLPKIQARAGTASGCAQAFIESEYLVQEKGNTVKTTAPSTSDVNPSFKVCLIGQLHLLSSPVTTLAVPSPSLTATLGRGGNHPASAVPLVALGTQSGNIDVIDVSANAVATSFSVHSRAIRGLRWLGNSRLVSFSYNQVNDKAGGFTNRLVVTCLRTGLNRTFRVLQKPERAPIRALRASSSGRYLLILFRDAPVEVWAMTKNPIMLRSLALPFTVMEWTLPAAPRPTQNGTSIQSSISSGENASDKDTVPNISPVTSKGTSSDASAEDTSESFAFALVNGALGVFEVQGRRIRDFRPKWPASSFVTSDGLITAMAYRLPHVVMGDRSGNIRWWDVTTGLSSSFTTYREGIRRIKFSPVVAGDCSRGRIAVLFYDNTFSVFDLDTQDPLANSLLQPQSPGTLVVELDWLPTRTHKNEPLVLCITGADSSFRLLEVNMNDSRPNLQRVVKERFRPMPVCLPVLLPTAHVLALRMILQLGVKPSWFSSGGTVTDRISKTRQATGEDFRNYMIESTLPAVGDPVVPELLLKVLEPYRSEGCILDTERARTYASIVNKGAAGRFAFAAAIFGEFSEALFWLQLPHALYHLLQKSSQRSPPSTSLAASNSCTMEHFTLTRITSTERTISNKENTKMKCGQLNLMAFEKDELRANAEERIPWHEKLDGEDAIQNRVHELISVGNLEAAVTLLLSTPPEGTYFYPNALRAVALSSAVSRSLHELAVKVVAANMVRTDKSLSGIHLLCAVGRYQEACSQLQDAGFWTDAATLAATYLHGSDYARVLQRWADHILHVEHNIWRALILYVAAGAVHEVLSALREAQHPDTAALFLLACHEINTEIASNSGNMDLPLDPPDVEERKFILPCMDHDQDVSVVNEYYGQYQRKLVQLCMDIAPSVN